MNQSCTYQSVHRYTLMCLLSFSTTVVSGQSENLLRNPDANNGAKHWRADGDAEVERTSDGELVFCIRKGGHFYQDVNLSQDAIGNYALLIGRVSSERVNTSGPTTGLPYLYGYMLDGRNVMSYLRGQQMRSRAQKQNEIVSVFGVFPVVEGTRSIRFFLNQSSAKGVPHNGSAARFDDLGLYLFTTEKAARAFIKVYEEEHE